MPTMGFSAIIVTVVIILMNIGIAFGMSLAGACRKMKLNWIKKKNVKK